MRPGGHRRHPGRHPRGTSATSRSSTAAPGCGCSPARRCAGQRPAGPARAQARPRPGQRDRLHPRRCRRQQLQRHGLRHRARTPTARWTRWSLVLPSGTVIDTGAADADERLRHDEPELYAGTARGCATGSAATRSRSRTIEQQFSMKNTMGYGLNSLLDHDRPVDILAHLVVGSEGTLAFVAEATFRTVPLLPARDDRPAGLRRPAAAPPVRCPPWSATGPATIELLDAASLRVGAGRPAGRREPAADRRRPARRAAGRVPGATRRRRSPSSARPRARCCASLPVDRPGRAHRRPARAGRGCGTPARASTPPSPGPVRPAPPRCWRTSSSRCRRCWTPASS